MNKIRIIGVDYDRFYRVQCPVCGSIWEYTFEEYWNLSNPEWTRCPGCNQIVDIPNYRQVLDVDIDLMPQEIINSI